MSRYLWGVLTILVFTSSELLTKRVIADAGAGFMARQNIVGVLGTMAQVPVMWLALFMRGVGLLLWFFVLSRFPLSQAYGLLSLMYVVMYLGAWQVLGEPLTVARSLGCLLIGAGVLLMGR